MKRVTLIFRLFSIALFVYLIYRSFKYVWTKDDYLLMAFLVITNTVLSIRKVYYKE